MKTPLADIYLKQNMKSYLLKGNQASQLLGLQSKHLKQLKKEGLIDDFRHMEMSKMLVEFIRLQGKSERIKNFPYPRQFATLNYIFIWIFILLFHLELCKNLNLLEKYFEI